MSYEQIDVASGGGVAMVTLQRPQALNAITPQMLDELNSALADLEADDSISVAILTGEGRAFSAGVDLTVLANRDRGEGDIMGQSARDFTRRLSDSTLITIAKVNGYCFTGALELALACDLMVVAEEAKLADTHAKFGLRPTWGMSQRLPAAVGMTRARELSYTARTITGTEAAEMGMACRAVPLAELDQTVQALANSIAENSAGSLAAYKDLYRVAESSGMTEGLAYEASTNYAIADTADRVAGFLK